MLIMVIGGSCVGKTTLCEKITKIDKDCTYVKTFTNRPKRKNESSNSYKFISDEEAEKMLHNKLYILDTEVETYLGENDTPKMNYWFLFAPEIKIATRSEFIYIKDSCYQAYKNIIDSVSHIHPKDILLIYLYCGNKNELNKRYEKRFNNNGGEKEKQRRIEFDNKKHEEFMNDVIQGKIKSPLLIIDTSIDIDHKEQMIKYIADKMVSNI